MEQKIDLGEIKSVYMIGIKGSGMIAFVEIFHTLGKDIHGSDVAEKFFTDATLDKLGIEYTEGFSRKNIAEYKNVDLVVHSTAYTEDNNVELEYAKKNDLTVLSYPEMISLFSQEKDTIAICGTHGKTTTSAMTTLALQECEADPTAIIGSKVKQLNASTVVGSSNLLVIEADEYQNKLANYSPLGVVLLNVEFDHPDFFPTMEEYQNVFIDFIKKIPDNGFLVVCGDDMGAIKVARHARCRVVVYGGFAEDGRIQEVGKILDDSGVSDFEFFLVPGDLNMRVAGNHNRLNATAVLSVCKQLKLDAKKARRAVEKYEGVSRRFETIGSRKKALIIDDYAHHPTEIKVTLDAAREKFPNKNIICIFHPHTFTRTKALIDDFATSFADADEVIILDIYGSAREAQGGVSSEELVQKIAKFHKNAKHIATLEEVFENIKNRIGGNDIVLTAGAGDVDKLARRLVEDV